MLMAVMFINDGGWSATVLGRSDIPTHAGCEIISRLSAPHAAATEDGRTPLKTARRYRPVTDGALLPPTLSVPARAVVVGASTFRNSSSALLASSAAARPVTGLPWIVPVTSQLCHIPWPLQAGTIFNSQPADGADSCQPDGRSERTNPSTCSRLPSAWLISSTDRATALVSK